MSEKEESNEEEVQHTFKQLKEYSGINFNFYKEASVYRRIIRYMLIINLQSFKDYDNYLKEHPEELNLLYNDMLINVTRFFGEPDANEYLSSTLLPTSLKINNSTNLLDFGCLPAHKARKCIRWLYSDR